MCFCLCHLRTQSNSYVVGKCRLAPIKEISIFMLELLVCFFKQVETSVKTAVESEVEIVRVFYWMESQFVLYWIWQVYIRSGQEKNRFKKIWENVDCKNWFHVPTALNPADICTREYSIKRLKECSL